MHTCGDTASPATSPAAALPGGPSCPHAARVLQLPTPTGPLREAFLDSPKTLAIEAGLVGCPGGVPACVLLRVGAAYLVRGDGARLKAQGLVVGALCKTREKYLKGHEWLCVLGVFAHLLSTPPVVSLSSLARMLGMLLNPDHNPCSIYCPRAMGSSFLTLLLCEFLTHLPLSKPVLPCSILEGGKLYSDVAIQISFLKTH